MPYYLTCQTNGAVRFSENSPPDLLGIGTKSIHVCTAIFLIGEKRVSLIHVDAMSDLTGIKTEQQWIGDIKEIRLVKNLAGIASAVAQHNVSMEQADSEQRVITYLEKENLFDKVTKRLNTRTGMIFISRDLRVTQYATPEMNVQNTPNAELRLAINLVNACFSPAATRSIELEFDGANYTSVPAILPRSIRALEIMEQKLGGQHDIGSIHAFFRGLGERNFLASFAGTNYETNALLHFQRVLDFRSQPVAATAPRI